MPKSKLIIDIHALEIERFCRLCQLRRYEEAALCISCDGDLEDEEDKAILESYRNTLLEKVAELRAEMDK